jgi:hypothetical protein
MKESGWIASNIHIRYMFNQIDGVKTVFLKGKYFSTSCG